MMLVIKDFHDFKIAKMEIEKSEITHHEGCIHLTSIHYID